MPRLLCAALVLYCATVYAGTGFPELAGFFTDTSAGVYQTRGARLAVTARAAGVSFDGIALRHLGAQPVTPIGVDVLPAVVHTYIGARRTTARAFHAVEYRDLYPGITLRLSFDGRAVKADYVLAPGADPRAIAFQYENAPAVLDGGDLVVEHIRQPAPIVLQGKGRLPAQYVMGEDNWVRFAIAPHDPALPLIIDPYVITASAYFGGSLTDRISAMAKDSAGYIYVTGSTESTDFLGSFGNQRVNGVEAYVLKIDPATLQMMYATYLGGSGDDRALAIAVDSGGSAYVAGFTGSGDFPASNSFSGGSTDAFLARLNTSGALQFATLVGGTRADVANGVAVKPDGSAWIVGETSSTNLPLHGVPYQSLNRGGVDAFVANISGSGAITHAGYFGGSADDRAVAVAIDAAGELYFTGGAESGNFPAANAYRNFNSGLQDAFISKLSSDGGTLRYSTYLGGSGGVAGQGEVGNWIAVDSAGVATIVGTTGSTNFPVTPASAIQPLFGGGATDAFVAKISAAGTSLLYSTFFGGVSTDEGWAGAFASDGTFYFGGHTASPGLPSYDSLQSTIGGDLDGFFAKLNAPLSSILSFSYLGYTGTESLTGLAVTSSALVLAGNSSSQSWLTSGGFKGWYDGWVMTLAENALAVQMASTPAGIAFTVTGSGCSPASGTTPATLAWKNGASCTVAATSPQDSGDTRRTFQTWADGLTTNPRTFVASAGTLSYAMQFGTEHRLMRSVALASAGVVSGADGFYAAGSTMQLSATANAGYQFSGWSGSASGSANPTTVTMTAPQSITANFAVLTTFNSTASIPFTISGTGCAGGTYTAPVTLAWTYGATCSVSFTATNVSADVRTVFSRWSDGPTANPRSLTASAPATYTLEWNTEYRLTRAVTGSGSVSGADGFYPAGTTVPLTTTPSGGYQFSSWSGDASGTANPLSVVMNAPKTVTANFTPRTAQVNINSNVATVQFSVSGTGCTAATYTAPASFSWAEGLSCTISMPSVQGGDARSIFQSWSDGLTATTRSVTATAPSVTYTMSFATEYKLTRLVTGQGTASGADGFYPAGSSLQMTATPGSGYQFTGWSGTVASAANPLTFSIAAPSTITANFSAAPVAVAIGANVTAEFSVSGTGCPAGTYTAPANVTWTNGTACTVTAVSPQGSPYTQYVFANWNDGVTSNSRSITAASGISQSMTFTMEHKLTRAVSGQGTVSGSDGFYAADSTVQLTASAASGYQFAGWSGAATGTANPLSLVMTGAKAVTAVFTAAPIAVRLEGNVATNFTVSDAGCPVGTYSTPATLMWTNGVACTIAIGSPQGSSDTRWVFKNWLDGATSNTRSLTASTGIVYTMIMGAEHRLTRSGGGAGTVSGTDGFYTAGSTVQLTATPQAGYQFIGWSGAVTGAANPLTLSMDAPKTVTASFAAVPTGVRFDSNVATNLSVSGAGCPAGAYVTPVTLTWPTGAACDISVQAPAATTDTRWIFSKWADGPTGAARTITASPGSVYTIVVATEYRLTRNVSGSGSVNASDGFYAAGVTVQLTATAQGGSQFTGWTGAATGSANPLTVVMDGPKFITATFGALTTTVRIEANTVTQFSVSGTNCPAGSYTTASSVAWTTGTSCTISVISPQGSGDTRWVFSRWADGVSANSRAIAATAGAAYTITMSPEHRLSRTISGGGSISGADGFYAAGTILQLTASPQTGYQFAGWSGLASGSANPLTVVMDGPKSITASFVPAAIAVRIDSNTAAQISVSGAGCAPGTYTAPVNLAWIQSATCTVTAQTPQGGPDTRFVFSKWSDGVTANPRSIVASPGAVYTLAFTTEYRLTRSVSGQGTVSGVDGFYPALSNVQLSATPASGYVFTGWSGTGGGSANPVTIRMDGPTTMIANFPVGVDVGTFTPLSGAGPTNTFTATFTHGGGVNELYLGYMLFLPTSNIVQYTATGSCLVEYNRISNGMRLIDNAGTGWLGPLEGVRISPTAGTLTNRQCTLNISAASASLSGNTMTVTAPITFHSGVSPVMGTFLQAQDVHGIWTGMTQYGNWEYSGGTPRPGPSVVSVASSSAQGSSAVYTFTSAHTSGASWLTMINLLISDRIFGGSPCHALYFPGNNTFNLVKDDSTGLVSSDGVSPGTSGTIANSRCAINTGQASRSVSGNKLTVVFPLTFQRGTFGGAKKIYANVFDMAGQLSHWVQVGGMNVQ